MIERVRAAVAEVRDPELTVLSISDLGILRDVLAHEDGRVVVTITPTYLGCPAMAVIAADIRAAATAAGGTDVEVVTSLSPPWSTDWLSDTARAKLAAADIAPPAAAPDGRPLLPLVTASPSCPRCRSGETTELARFGSTACLALWRCESCREPFDHLKGH
ncbi:phenylacetate-CoA oxygenase subunit PaaJ [Actinophytocola sediminis]